MFRRKFLWFLLILPLLAAIGLGAEAVYLFTHPAIVVEWSTASELNTVGFNLYRSEEQKGETQAVNDQLMRVNAQLIPSSSDALMGGDYSYRDISVKAGHTYYYWLEDVDANGTTDRNGPVQVKAEIGGIPEMAAALLLAAISATGGVLLRRSYRTDKREDLAHQ